MANVDLTIIKVNSNVQDIEAAVTEKVRLALDLMGETVEGYAKEDCPVDTGLLRNSITHTLSGVQIKHSYHASYGSNRNASGKRYGAGAKNAGSVGYGVVSGTMGNANDNACYVGSNVEYAPTVEYRDIGHRVGKAHFLRDGAQYHINELKAVAEATLKSL